MFPPVVSGALNSFRLCGCGRCTIVEDTDCIGFYQCYLLKCAICIRSTLFLNKTLFASFGLLACDVGLSTCLSCNSCVEF